MGDLKTLCASGFLALSVPLTANADQPDPLVMTFATCTGRLSALMEHQWLIGSPDADRTQHRRAQMETLLFSTMAKGTGRLVLARRIEAKFALAALLTRVTFTQNPTESAWAASRVEVQIASCDSLLLG